MNFLHLAAFTNVLLSNHRSARTMKTSVTLCACCVVAILGCGFAQAAPGGTERLSDASADQLLYTIQGVPSDVEQHGRRYRRNPPSDVEQQMRRRSYGYRSNDSGVPSDLVQQWRRYGGRGPIPDWFVRRWRRGDFY